MLKYILKISNSEIGKRTKSLLWRALGMGVATSLSYLASNIADLQLPVYVTVSVGLILGEVTKHLNNRLSTD